MREENRYRQNEAQYKSSMLNQASLFPAAESCVARSPIWVQIWPIVPLQHHVTSTTRKAPGNRACGLRHQHRDSKAEPL